MSGFILIPKQSVVACKVFHSRQFAMIQERDSTFCCKGVVPITTTIKGSKMFLEYHIFHHPDLTFILVGVTLRTLLRGTNNGECVKMAVGHQEFSTSFAHAVNHVAEDELEEDLFKQVMSTTLEEDLSPPCLDDVADYFSPIKEEAKF
jgi:hypothetical protein